MTRTSFSVLSLGMAIVCDGCAVWSADASEEATDLATMGISQNLVLHSDYGEGTDRPDTSWHCP